MDDRTLELLADVLEWLQTGKIHGTVINRETVMDVLEGYLNVARARVPSGATEIPEDLAPALPRPHLALSEKS